MGTAVAVTPLTVDQAVELCVIHPGITAALIGFNMPEVIACRGDALRAIQRHGTQGTWRPDEFRLTNGSRIILATREQAETKLRSTLIQLVLITHDVPPHLPDVMRTRLRAAGDLPVIGLFWLGV